MLEETLLDYALVRVFAGNLPYKRAGLRHYVSRSGSPVGSCRRLLPDDGLCGSNSRRPDRAITSGLPTILDLGVLNSVSAAASA